MIDSRDQRPLIAISGGVGLKGTDPRIIGRKITICLLTHSLTSSLKYPCAHSHSFSLSVCLSHVSSLNPHFYLYD